MIAKMAKVFIVARGADRDQMLEALRDLGVVHLKAAAPAKAAPGPQTASALERTERALQILAAVEPAGAAPEVAPAEAAAEVLHLQRHAAERQEQLNALHRQIEHLALWGDVRLEQLEVLRQADIVPRFYLVPAKKLDEVRGDFVHVLSPWPGGRLLLAVISRGQEPSLPQEAVPLPLPERDRPSIRAEAAAIDRQIKADAARLAALAHLLPALRRECNRLRQQAAYEAASESGLAAESLYALQGWVPEEIAAQLAPGLAERGLHIGLQTLPPADDEDPPTLLNYTWWTRPIKGLFDILGTVPGYREFDVSAAFMIALPIFAAILISDAGYGLIYLLLPIIFYRRMAAQSGPELPRLVITVGTLSVIWGIITCSFFGFDISGLLAAVPLAGGLFRSGPPVAVDMVKTNMDRLMLISFTLGAIHLSSAHLWKAKAAFPHLRFLGSLGWAIWLWGMYGAVRMLVLGHSFSPNEFPYYPYLLVVGGALAILFAEPSRNVLKALALGLANFPLSAVGTFGDSVSYVRLMAIGVAGSALALAFNDMGKALPWFGMVPVLMVGHALNVSLSIVSLFAHGVRLNMLEYSNNLGMQWSGYAYEPFSRKPIEET